MKNRFVLVTFVLLVVVLIYAQVKGFPFITFDDDVYVYNNSIVKSGLSLENLHWAFSFESSRMFHTYYHPLTWLSHMIDCQLFGLNPGAHHLVNVFFHMLNTLLLFGLLWKASRNFLCSVFVAALFAFHPLNVDTVVWIAERKNLLSTFFMLLSLIAYVFYVEKPTISRYALVFVFLFLGLLAKPMVIILPFIIFLMDFWPLKRVTFPFVWSSRSGSESEHAKTVSIRYIILEKVPFLLLISFYIPVCYLSLQVNHEIIGHEIRPFALRFAHAIVSYILYLEKMILPLDLAVFHPYPVSEPLWKVFGALAIILCITLSSITKLIKAPYIMVGWLWYLITLTPVLGIIQGGLWPSYAGRWAYVPLIGIYIILAWGMMDLFKWMRPSKVFKRVIPVILLLYFVFLAWIQTNYWRNSVTLFVHSLDVTTNNDIIQTNLAYEYQRLGIMDKAGIHYKEAVKIKPDNWIYRNNLGNFFFNSGKLRESLEQYSIGIKMAPRNKILFFNLGIGQARLGSLDKSVESFKKALQLDPDFQEAHLNLGETYLKQKDISGAIHSFLKAKELKPESDGSYLYLGYVYSSIGRFDDAEAQYRQLLDIYPSHQFAQKNLHIILSNKTRRPKLKPL